MMLVSSIFFASLTSIVALFSLKLWEERRERAFAPGFRQHVDNVALVCKRFFIEAEEMMVRFPSLTAHLMLRALEAGAIGFAQLARTASEAAHRLADFVSHKRNFERRETRSEFLKQVIEHKNGLNGVTPKKKIRREVDVRV